MLEAAHALRLEREREKSLGNQKQEQQASLTHTEQQVQRLQQQLKEMQQAASGATAEGYFSLLMLCINMFFVVRTCLLNVLKSEYTNLMFIKDVVNYVYLLFLYLKKKQLSCHSYTI